MPDAEIIDAETTAIAKPVEKPATITVGARGLQLTTLDEMTRFATGVIASGFAPPHYKTPVQVISALQYGAEIGLSPMQSLQSITVINGRPALWGDALPGLVWGSGLCEGIEESLEESGEPDDTFARCTVKRKGIEKPITKTFSVKDAKRAGLWGKGGPWTQYPQRMLQLRARAFCLRDAFADVLRGLQVSEEVQDYSAGVQVEAKPWTPPTE